MSYRTNFFLLSLSSSSWPLSLSYPDVLVFRILSLLILCTSLGNLRNSFKLNSDIATFLKAMHFKQTHLSLISVAACTWMWCLLLEHGYLLRAYIPTEKWFSLPRSHQLPKHPLPWVGLFDCPCHLCWDFVWRDLTWVLCMKSVPL